jgi:DNA replication protein DnaC
VVTTNKTFSEWSEVFPNAGCVVSLVNRLLHHSEVIAVEGKSYRLKEAKERSALRESKRRKPKK